MNNPAKHKTLLGPSPWDKEHLRNCYFQDLEKTKKEIDQLPGGILFNEIKSLRLSLNIFLDSVNDLIKSINNFKHQSASLGFWYKSNRFLADKLEISIQRGILSSAMCALALVDHSNIFSDKYQVEGYENKVSECFHNNEHHRFIHSLRRYITHVRFTKANWKICHSDQGRAVYFLLAKEDLMRFKDWNSIAKSFILRQEQGINVEDLFESYSIEVKKFHDWLRISLLGTYGDILTEYLNYIRTINGISSKCNWSILIKQVIPQHNADPYVYLDQYLSEEELEDVLSLPFRSKIQIDRIIELLDDYQICDESLREDIYKVCKAKET